MYQLTDVKKILEQLNIPFRSQEVKQTRYAHVMTSILEKVQQAEDRYAFDLAIETIDLALASKLEESAEFVEALQERKETLRKKEQAPDGAQFKRVLQEVHTKLALLEGKIDQPVELDTKEIEQTLEGIRSDVELLCSRVPPLLREQIEAIQNALGQLSIPDNSDLKDQLETVIGLVTSLDSKIDEIQPAEDRYRRFFRWLASILLFLILLGGTWQLVTLGAFGEGITGKGTTPTPTTEVTLIPTATAANATPTTPAFTMDQSMIANLASEIADQIPAPIMTVVITPEPATELESEPDNIEPIELKITDVVSPLTFVYVITSTTEMTSLGRIQTDQPERIQLLLGEELADPYFTYDQELELIIPVVGADLSQYVDPKTFTLFLTVKDAPFVRIELVYITLQSHLVGTAKGWESNYRNLEEGKCVKDSSGEKPDASEKLNIYGEVFTWSSAQANPISGYLIENSESFSGCLDKDAIELQIGPNLILPNFGLNPVPLP